MGGVPRSRACMHPASWFAHSKRKKAQLLLLCLVFLACLALLFRSSKTPALFTRRGTSRPCDCATWHESVQEWVHLPQSAQGRRCKMKDNTQPDMHTSS